MSIFDHQKGSLVDKNHKETSKFSDIQLIFWHFPLVFLTRITTPTNWKKCSKGYIATIFITGYYHWRINFFFENQPTSGWDTAKFFVKINAPGITHKIKVVVNISNIQNSEKFLKIDDIRLRKLRFYLISCII